MDLAYLCLIVFQLFFFYLFFFFFLIYGPESEMESYALESFSCASRHNFGADAACRG